MKSSQNSSVDNQISVYDMASARFAEGRAIGADVVSVYEIASRYNRSLAEGNPDPAFKRETKPLSEVAKYAIPGRTDLTERLKKDGTLNDKLHDYIQPCLIIEDDGVRIFFDGVGRFNRLATGRAASIRLLNISKSDALMYGRTTIDVIGTKGAHIALDKLKSGRLTSPAVSLTGSKKISAPILTRQLSQARAAQRQISSIRIPGAVVLDNVLLVQTVSNVAFPENQEMISFVRNPWTSTYGQNGKAGIFPVSIDRNEALFGRGNAKNSCQDISIIVFLAAICHTIGEIENRINPNNRRSGRTIIFNTGLYQSLIQQGPQRRRGVKQRVYLSAKNFSEWQNQIVNHWNVLGNLIEIEFLGIQWPDIDLQTKLGLTKIKANILKLFELGLRTLWRSQFITSNMRGIDANNFGHGQIKNPRKPFAHELFGTEDDQKYHHVDESGRAVLALYGRINPGKLWQDRHLDVLRFEWHIAIGDLARNQSMFVTRMMAQEFIIYNGLREGGDQDTLQYDWSLVHAGLAYALREHPARADAFGELRELCWKSMRENVALRVTIDPSTTRCFDPKSASIEDSAAGDAVTLFV